MIPVEEARARIVALMPEMAIEDVPLLRAGGRILAREVRALHDQPPFAASAMDGYALSGEAPIGTALRLIGEAAAGHPFDGRVMPGQAARIFTGAPLPEGADRVLIQEDAEADGPVIIVSAAPAPGQHVRPAAGDFHMGDPLPPGPLTPARIALAAAMGHATLPVRRRPDVAILMTGDELRAPGDALPPGAIPASNGYGLAAMLASAGARPRLLPIAPDDPELLRATLALGADADLIVTIGGASVGAHDLVAGLGRVGMDLAFHKVRMRPGKPLIAGRYDGVPLIGLPGNPVSAMVCGTVFLLPALRSMLGLPTEPIVTARPLATAIGANGPREHYQRARLQGNGAVDIAARQDSSLLTVLAQADLLVRRAPGDRAREAGETVDTLPLD